MVRGDWLAGWLAGLILLLVGCGQTAVSPPPLAPLPVLQETAVVFLPPSPTPAAAETAVTPTTLPTETATAVLLPTSTPIPGAIPTPDPYAAYTIAELIARPYGGGLLQIVDTIEQNDDFTRYLITYPSDGLTIYGFMNVPRSGSAFPVVIMLHGYVPPEEYETVAYTRRYADDLARAGYFVIHPNLRNYPPSDSGADPFRIGYATDVLNLIAILREQSQDPTGVLRRADADQIHLWGHSMGGGIALRVAVVNNAEYVKTAVLYASMSGDESLNYAQIQQWSSGSRGAFELAASPEALAAISPINHLDRLQAAVSIHHSLSDERVPVAWSEALCARLAELGHPTDCFIYNGLPHTFRGAGDQQFMERVRQFYGRFRVD
jgi:uncharacterized protein